MTHITPYEGFLHSHLQHRIDPQAREIDITAALDGIEPDRDDGKVTRHWQFRIDGQPCAIWDYRGARWSAFGPVTALRKLGFVVSEGYDPFVAPVDPNRAARTAQLVALRAAAPMRRCNGHTADVDGLALFDTVRSPSFL